MCLFMCVMQFFPSLSAGVGSIRQWKIIIVTEASASASAEYLEKIQKIRVATQTVLEIFSK